jgi:hypothetical protein
MSAVSFRLAPNTLESGESVTIHAEWAPPETAGQRVTLELTETNAEGSAVQVVARFAATIVGSGASTWAFDAAERQAVSADVGDDMQLPAAAAETSRDGTITVPGTETTWQRAHLKVKLEGCPEEHLVILRTASGSDARQREGGVFELGLVVKDSSGAQLFSTGTQLTLVDCWKALITNCVSAVSTMHDVHVYLCAERTTGGDYYGSKSSGSAKAGKKVTDCVSYVVQVLERAYGELRSKADYAYLQTRHGDYKRWHLGSLFAPALHELGWSLLLFGRDATQMHKNRHEDYTAGIYTKAVSKGTLYGRPVEVVGDYNPQQDWDTETTRPADAVSLARYEALAQIPFGICALSLGSHVVMKVGAAVYECHWGRVSTEADLFDRASLSWEGLKDEDCFYMACPTYALLELEAEAGE